MTREEAINVVKNNWPDSSYTRLQEALETLIPELKESKDERLRKRLLSRLDYWAENGSDADREEISAEKAWLEKQGEQKPAWSEEDEIGLGDALWCCKQAASIAKDENDMGNAWFAEKWLKSLKPQPHWKPSEEQMEALKYALGEGGHYSKSTLESLYSDLQKL